VYAYGTDFYRFLASFAVRSAQRIIAQADGCRPSSSPRALVTNRWFFAIIAVLPISGFSPEGLCKSVRCT
jgi:hypothetical protein